MCVCVRYRMGDFSGDTLRAVSRPLVEKPVYNTLVTFNNISRHRTDMKMKVPTITVCRGLTACCWSHELTVVFNFIHIL